VDGVVGSLVEWLLDVLYSPITEVSSLGRGLEWQSMRIVGSES